MGIPDETAEIMYKPPSRFAPISTAPRDGSKLDVLCREPSGREIVVPELAYGHAPMDKNRTILWGRCNFLSPYLMPIGWRAHDPDAVAKEAQSFRAWDKATYGKPEEPAEFDLTG